MAYQEDKNTSKWKYLAEIQLGKQRILSLPDPNMSFLDKIGKKE